MRPTKLRPHGLFFLAFCAIGAPALATGCSQPVQAQEPVGAAAPWKTGDGQPIATDEKYDPRVSLAPMLEKVMPTVVSIEARGKRSSRFGFPTGSEGSGLGSGFILSKDGKVVTNHHVVAGNRELRVHLPDGRVFDAKLIGSDPQTDVALIQLEHAKDLPVVTLGSSESMRVGDWVMAVGSPIGLEQTVTRGIVSAKGRGSLGLYEDGFADFLQTDAAISPGNSGGPLFNLNGEVVGINTAIAGHANGIGFSVPIDQAKFVLSALEKDGKVERGWLGISGRSAQGTLGRAPKPGAVVDDVHPDTPAAKAGLQGGDRIVAIDGKEIDDFDALRTRIGMYGPGDTVKLRLIRGGKTKTLKVDLAARPTPSDLVAMGRGRAPSPAPTPKSTPKPAPSPKKDLWDGGTPVLGVGVRTENNEVVVQSVDPGSIAQKLRLQPGDRFRTINGQTIQSVEDVRKALRKDAQRVSVEVNRGGSTHGSMLQVK